MGRMMKYDLRSMSKIFIPLWLGVLVLSIVNRFTVWERTGNEALDTLRTIVLVVYILAIIGVGIFSFVYVILRFYQGMVKDEGYLTFTLPLGIDSILWAKAFAALIITIISAVVCVGSIFIIVIRDMDWMEVGWMWQGISQQLGGTGSLTLCVFLFAILLAAGMIESVMQMYLAMAIGQLAQKHKVGTSIFSYVGINIALSTLSSVCMTALVVHNEISFEFSSQLMPMDVVWMVFGVGMLSCVVFTALFYFPTRYIFSKRLNLE